MFRGLGIRSIRNHNKAMLGKWLCRFGTDKENLWRKVMVARYGDLSECNPKDI